MPTNKKKTALIFTDEEMASLRTKLKKDETLNTYIRTKLGLKPLKRGAPKKIKGEK